MPRGIVFVFQPETEATKSNTPAQAGKTSLSCKQREGFVMSKRGISSKPTENAMYQM
jgi:hypothetical protein